MTPAYERYAEALYKAAQDLDCTGGVAGELSAMEEVLARCAAYFDNPLIGANDKSAVLQALLAGKVSPLMLEFVLLLAARRHLKHFRPAAEYFRRLSSRSKVVVRLRVPFEPGQDLLEQLKGFLSKEKLIPADAEEAHFQIIEDKELIGGFVASYDGYQIDTSLKTALNKLLLHGRAGTLR